jgi:hypothetical protein
MKTGQLLYFHTYFCYTKNKVLWLNLKKSDALSSYSTRGLINRVIKNKNK